jgi:ribonuclease HI
MFQHTDSECMEMVSTIIYSIWFARNQRVFRNVTLLQVEISNKALLLLHEYQKTCAIKPSPHHSHPPASDTNSHNISWNPPTRGTLKINVDAHISDGRCFSGMILRRCDGSAVEAATRMHHHVRDALECEALGLNDALDMVERYSACNVVFELDNQVLVRAVQRKNLIRKHWGSVVTRCVDFLTRNPNSSIMWVNRNGNRVAHTLARWAKRESMGDWPNEVPECIKDLVLRDTPIL